MNGINYSMGLKLCSISLVCPSFWCMFLFIPLNYKRHPSWEDIKVLTEIPLLSWKFPAEIFQFKITLRILSNENVCSLKILNFSFYVFFLSLSSASASTSSSFLFLFFIFHFAFISTILYIYMCVCFDFQLISKPGFWLKWVETESQDRLGGWLWMIPLKNGRGASRRESCLSESSTHLFPSSD